jgi:hypothetical protein
LYSHKAGSCKTFCFLVDDGVAGVAVVVVEEDVLVVSVGITVVAVVTMGVTSCISSCTRSSCDIERDEDVVDDAVDDDDDVNEDDNGLCDRRRLPKPPVFLDRVLLRLRIGIGWVVEPMVYASTIILPMWWEFL